MNAAGARVVRGRAIHAGLRGLAATAMVAMSTGFAMGEPVVVVETEATTAGQPSTDDRVEAPADPAAVATGGRDAADELSVRYARMRLRLAELDVERAFEANEAVPNSIGARELERLRNHVDVMRRQVEIAQARPRASARQATIAAVEAARENARGDLAAAVAANQRTPGTVSRVHVERLKAKAELADIRLALCRSPEFELSLLAEMQWSIDQLTDEVIDLRHQIDSKAAGDAGR